MQGSPYVHLALAFFRSHLSLGLWPFRLFHLLKFASVFTIYFYIHLALALAPYAPCYTLARAPSCGVSLAALSPSARLFESLVFWFLLQVTSCVLIPVVLVSSPQLPAPRYTDNDPAPVECALLLLRSYMGMGLLMAGSHGPSLRSAVGRRSPPSQWPSRGS